ncbi:hypothetical protein [Salegentibacter salegens]|uniref:Uncharacterized protein n=1 Tax=Salegentibacter salegens TaxID=143223 RepID=A0A1M7M8G9_9FLAO|nr:hypothetical protein [Salegentibacter salegens]PRX51546.1 hypothetical protein LY58_00620 [Salegentibacter salegens]SHM86975.1 hypothetical protein SAMN05878281_2338 [Salegentibacter salegens]
MRKNIDIDDLTLKKIKLISAYENISVKALLEKAVHAFVKNKELEKYASLTDEEKEDLGLLALMQQNDPEDNVPEEEIFKLLKE